MRSYSRSASKRIEAPSPRLDLASVGMLQFEKTDADRFPANLYRDKTPNRVILSNGLIKRTIQMVPNAATIEIKQLTTGQSVLRAVRPEAIVSHRST